MLIGPSCGGTTGVKNRRDELQKLQSELGKAITEDFWTTNLSVVMVEPGLRLAESLLNNRSPRRVLRLMSLPREDQAMNLLGYDSAMGQRMVHFSDYSGRVDTTGGRANGTQRQRLGRRRGVGRTGGETGGLPTGAGALDGRVSGRERGGGVRGGVEERTELGRGGGPHGPLSRGLRR